MLDTFEISSWIQRHLHNFTKPSRPAVTRISWPCDQAFLTPATNKKSWAYDIFMTYPPTPA